MLSDALCKIFFGRVDYSHIEIMYVGFRKSDRTVTCAKPFLFSCFRYAAFLIAMSSCCFQINGFLSLKLFNNEILSFMCACLFLVFSLSSTLWGSGVLPFLKKKKKEVVLRRLFHRFPFIIQLFFLFSRRHCLVFIPLIVSYEAESINPQTDTLWWNVFGFGQDIIFDRTENAR